MNIVWDKKRLWIPVQYLFQFNANLSYQFSSHSLKKEYFRQPHMQLSSYHGGLKIQLYCYIKCNINMEMLTVVVLQGY